MRESREQIVNYIKQYKAQDVKLLYELMAKILLGNNDFRLVEKAERDDLVLCQVLVQVKMRKISLTCHKHFVF